MPDWLWSLFVVGGALAVALVGIVILLKVIPWGS